MQTVIAVALVVIAVVLVAIFVLLIIFLKKKASAPTSASVQTVQDGAAQDIPRETTFAGEYTIQLSDVRHPEQKWRLTVLDEIIIGRDDDCALVLTDSRVSRRQCKISVGREGLIVTNLSETNETKHNGLKISGSNPINAGDVLKLGHEELRVDFIESQEGISSYEPAQQSTSGGPKVRYSSDDTRHFF